MIRRSLVALGLIATAACGGSSGGPDALQVHAASSLTEAFSELAETFDGTPVTLTFGSSASLARQIADGAQADVFASADTETMGTATRQGSIEPSTSVVFARNRAAILVERGNPLDVRGLADLARDDLAVVRCAPAVPCGRLADAVLQSAGVEATPRSLEDNVKGVVAKVALGEADAGLVYESDVVAAERAGQGQGVAVDATLESEYVIAVATSARRPDDAEAWITHVRSAEGRRVLTTLGFRAP